MEPLWQKYAAAIQGYDELMEAAEATAERWLNVTGRGSFWIEHIKLEYCCYEPEEGDDEPSGSIQIYTEISHCSCCSPDREYFSIPISYIWDPEWEEKARKEQEEKERKKREEAARKKAEQEEQRRLKRYNDFLKMKEEFEGKE